MSEQQDRAPHVDWVKVLAGALAAMLSAVLLSTLGAAGTIIGAAVGSVVITVGNALFSRGIDASKQRVSAAQFAALRRVGRARSQLGSAAEEVDGTTRAQQRLSDADRELDAAESELADAGEQAGERAGEQADEQADEQVQQERTWQQRFAELPWKRLLLVSAGLFVAAMVVITAFELASGRAVSSYTGGSDRSTRTSFTGLEGGGPSHSPSPTPSSSVTPSASGSSTVPTESPTESPGASTTPSPTAEPSSTPSETETETESPTTSPTVGTSSAVPTEGTSTPIP